MNRKPKRILLGVAAAVLIVAVVGYILRQQIIGKFFEPTPSPVAETQAGDERKVTTMHEGLTTPWSITFLPDGDMLVTERSGQLQRIGENGQTITVTGVRETSEGGLLGVALHPDFVNNNQLYLYYTTQQSGSLTNRIERYELRDNSLAARRVIVADIPAASNHNGGAIAFGPDGKLYVTTGDAATPDQAQSTNSLAGKILRLNDDGSVPSDNPFNNLVWSYGHRNPQGIAWDNQQRLWSVEHGPSGTESGRDELNLITRGGNYGWPEITGDQTSEGMIAPVAQSGADDTWAPAGMSYYNGALYFAGLRGQALYVATINGDDVSLSRSFVGEYGRLRAVTTHQDSVYFSTSNHDGRGSPRDGDDKIIRTSGL